MNIPHGVIRLDIKRLQLADFIEIAAAGLRENGKEEDAVALFKLRTKIREGLSYEEAKLIFDKHTKSILSKKQEHLA